MFWFDKIRTYAPQQLDLSFFNTINDLRHEDEILQTSSKLLLFHVEDILGLAQIKSGKFTQILQPFSIQTAV